MSQSIGKESVLPHINDIRSTVDQNALLKETLQKLYTENEALLKLYATLEKRHKLKIKKRDALKRKLYDFPKHSITKEQGNLLTQVFSESQINVLLNKEKVYWSHDDMAMAFTLRQMANRETYLYLKKMLNVPLPSLSSVQKWAASK